MTSYQIFRVVFPADAEKNGPYWRLGDGLLECFPDGCNVEVDVRLQDLGGGRYRMAERGLLGRSTRISEGDEFFATPHDQGRLRIKAISVLPGPERRDADLDSQQIQDLWEIDAERCLLEWTYRVWELPVIEDPLSFLKWLTEKYCSSRRHALKNMLFDERIRQMLNAYEAGNLTLDAWCYRVRCLLTGTADMRTHIATPNPELQRAANHLFSALRKKFHD